MTKNDDIPEGKEALILEVALLKSRFVSELGGPGTPGNVNRNVERLWDEHRALAERCNHFIDGNGKEGANVRFDRLEQAAIAEKERHNKWFGILSAGLVTALGVAVKGAFFG